MKFNSLKLSSFAFIFVLTSCDKNSEGLAPVVTNKITASIGYVVRDGYMVFDSKESFSKTINSIINLSETDRNKWENEISFNSQQRITNNVIREELKKDSINRIKFGNTNLSPTKNLDYNSVAFTKALSEVSKSDLHSEAYYKALSKGVIKIIDEGTENEYWDFNVFNRCFVGFINEDGFYGIADTLYQITDKGINAIKYIDNSSKINLLKKATSSTVNKILLSPTQNADSPGVLSSGWVQEPIGPWYPKRIKLDVELSLKYLMVSTLSFEFYHRFYVTCQQRNIFRTWVWDVTNINLSGSWEISVYRYPQTYSGSYTYTGNVSDVYGSLNPESNTNWVDLYDSYYAVWPNQGNFEYGNGWPERQMPYQPIFNGLNWSVTRTDKNLTARIQL
jgi:hypothetical protein